MTGRDREPYRSAAVGTIVTFSVTSGTTGDGRTPPPGTRVECGTLAEGTFMTSRTNRFTHPIAKATALAAVCALAVAACSSSKKTSAPASSAASTPAASAAATTSASSAPTTAASAPASSPASGGTLNGGKPMTLTWWHNVSTDPGKTAVPEGGRRLPRCQPQRHHQGAADPERKHQDQGSGRAAGHPARHLPAVGWRCGGHSGPVGQAGRPHAADVQLDRSTRQECRGLGRQR